MADAQTTEQLRSRGGHGNSERAQKRSKLVSRLAARFGVDEQKLWTTLKNSTFKQRDGSTPSDDQMMTLLVLTEQYGLNPFTGEIRAFSDKNAGGIVPVVTVDGWSRIINDHPDNDGIEFRFADEEAARQDEYHQWCPAWCEAVIYRKDREHPTAIREYFDEVYRAPFTKMKDGERITIKGPWQTHTKRMLRHKTLIQGSRVAFGFSGIYDEDEAHRIIEGEATRAGEQPENPALTETPESTAEADEIDQQMADAAPEGAHSEQEAATADMDLE